MNRRIALRSLFGAGAATAGAIVTMATPPASAEPPAFTIPQICSKCGMATMVLYPRILPRYLMQCGGDPECVNRWPWIQSGTGAQRVTDKVRNLLNELIIAETCYRLSKYSDIESRDKSLNLSGLIAREVQS